MNRSYQSYVRMVVFYNDMDDFEIFESDSMPAGFMFDRSSKWCPDPAGEILRTDGFEEVFGDWINEDLKQYTPGDLVEFRGEVRFNFYDSRVTPYYLENDVPDPDWDAITWNHCKVHPDHVDSFLDCDELKHVVKIPEVPKRKIAFREIAHGDTEHRSEEKSPTDAV